MPTSPMLLCTARGLLRKMQKRATVGDRVHVAAIDWNSHRATVDDILKRESALTEPRVANVSHLVVVFAVAAPPFDPSPATRYLVAGEAAGLTVTVVLNKADLIEEEESEALAEEVRSWGYDVILASTFSGQGLGAIARALAGRTSVLAGPSGAGKSSIINALADMSRRAQGATGGRSSGKSWSRDDTDHGDDDRQFEADGATAHREDKSENNAEPRDGNNGESASLLLQGGAVPPMQAVGEVSPRIGRGRHTTRNVTLLPLGTGAVADTPGFNQPTLAGLDPRRLAACFPEVRRLAGGCAFTDCAHVHEPGCAVRAAKWMRYPLYVDLLDERRVAARLETLRGEARRAREGTARAKDRAGGHVAMEAKLETKKHRRVSRRAVHQGLQSIIHQELD